MNTELRPQIDSVRRSLTSARQRITVGLEPGESGMGDSQALAEGLDELVAAVEQLAEWVEARLPK